MSRPALSFRAKTLGINGNEALGRVSRRPRAFCCSGDCVRKTSVRESAKDLKGSLISTFSAFPFANLVAMLVGGIMTAALATPNANPFGADNMFGYMNDKQLAWLSVIAFIFLYCNLGSVSSHFLYNAATGWSRILGSHMRILAVALGVIGIIVAACNVWAFFIEWL